MAGTKQYPGVLQITANTFKLTLTDGYTEAKDKQGNVILDEQGNPKKQQKRYFKTVTAKSAKEASDLRAQWITEVKGGAVLTNNRMTLKQFYDYFKEHSEKLAPKTIQYYDGLFTRIEAALGHKKLDDINANNIRSFIKNLSEDGIYQGSRKEITQLSENTILKYHRMLNMLFNRAIKWGLASFNPCQHTDPPKTIKTIKKIYDEATTGKFLFLLEKEELKHRLMALLLISSGMRRGEMFGLQWHHIDFDKCTVKIEQASQYLPGKGIFIKETKNESSKRIITISTSIINLLKQYKAKQAAKRLKLGGTKDKGGKWEGAKEPEDDFIFTTWNGEKAHPDSVNTWLKKFIKDNDLPAITPHSFRHMAATYLITSGTDIRTVSGKLGHANTTTTTVVYSHLLKSAEKETTDKMENFLQQTLQKEKEKQKKQAK